MQLPRMRMTARLMMVGLAIVRVIRLVSMAGG